MNNQIKGAKMIVEEFDIEEDVCRYFVLKSAKMNYDCFNCDSTGKVRANKQTDSGYVFMKELCPSCKGTGLFKGKAS